MQTRCATVATIGIVQTLSLAAISVIAFGAAVALWLRLMDRRAPVIPVRVALGVVPALVGAFVVLVLKVDLVPDGPDEVFIRLFVVAVTVAAVVITWYRALRT
jgi:uncharacterized membrane protein YeaQ/YmgE (transglycosylase-associated protein family)